MNKNGLYQIKRHCWMLYPSKDIAAASSDTSPYRVSANIEAAYLSKQFKCNVSYLSSNTIFFPVETDGRYVKVISGEGVGWIIVEDWAKGSFEEVKE